VRKCRYPNNESPVTALRAPSAFQFFGISVFYQVPTPDRTAAAAFRRYLSGEVLARLQANDRPLPAAIRHPRVNTEAGKPLGRRQAWKVKERAATESITRAPQLIRAVTRNATEGEAGLSNAKQLRMLSRAGRPGFPTKRSLIEIALEVGYASPSAFAQVFRRVVGVTPTEFRGDH